jgi:hypothetical protein
MKKQLMILCMIAATINIHAMHKAPFPEHRTMPQAAHLEKPKSCGGIAAFLTFPGYFTQATITRKGYTASNLGTTIGASLNRLIAFKNDISTLSRIKTAMNTALSGIAAALAIFYCKGPRISLSHGLIPAATMGACGIASYFLNKCAANRTYETVKSTYLTELSEAVLLNKEADKNTLFAQTEEQLNPQGKILLAELKTYGPTRR